MLIQWPDPISLAADVVTFVGIPVLAFSTFQLWQELKRERAARKEMVGVSHGCLEFNLHGKLGINLVPLEKITLLPRPGDLVFLPGETREMGNRGGGVYEVEKIHFVYQEAPEIDQPCPALPSKIVAYVHRIERTA